MTPYLIQRGTFRSDLALEKKGLDQFVNFDYMGSSEFEWGALPKALKGIREFKDLMLGAMAIKNSGIVRFLCSEALKKDVKKCINLLAKDPYKENYRLKEYCDFRDGVNRKTDKSKKLGQNNFWWDIENHYMFWIDYPLSKELMEVVKGV